jgi:hypothetical protein
MERLHKLASTVIFVFLSLHITNHLVGLKGIEFHDIFLQATRIITRDPIIETVIILAFVLQIITGHALARTIWRERKDAVHQIQAASGTILSLFIILHLLQIALGRMVFDLDTNFYYVAAGFMASGWKYAFIALYGLGIFALFVHMGAMTKGVFKKNHPAVLYSAIIVIGGVGAFVAYLLVTLFSGHYFPIVLPDAYHYLYSRG